MPRRDQVLRVELPSEYIKVAVKHAQLAELGGQSSVRESNDRSAMLKEDQIVGQLGTMAGHLWLYGHINDYERTRQHANKTPWRGDNGSDVSGRNIDFKTSLMRASKDPLKYRMLVRPRERHERWVYVLVLVEEHTEDKAVIYIVGWLSDNELPDVVEQQGVFKGAYAVDAIDLHAVQPFRNVGG